MTLSSVEPDAIFTSAKEDTQPSLFVFCPFVCLLQLCVKKTSERICMKFSGQIGDGSMNKTIKFWWRSGSQIRITDPDPDGDTCKTCLAKLYTVHAVLLVK